MEQATCEKKIISKKGWVEKFKIEDPETGSKFWIDTSSEVDLKQMNDQNKQSIIDLEKNCMKIGLDIISITTKKDYVRIPKSYRSLISTLDGEIEFEEESLLIEILSNLLENKITEVAS